MRVILRDCTQDLYFLGRNMWTNDRTRARDFGYTAEAIWIAREAKLKDVELIVCFGPNHQELRVPLEALNQVEGR